MTAGNLTIKTSPAVIDRRYSSKRVLQRELQLSSWLRRQNLPELIAADIHECRNRARNGISRRRNRRNKTVRDVERIGANLHVVLFPNLEVAGQSHVETPETRADNAVPAQISHCAERLRRKGGRVEVLASCAALSRVHLVRK